MFKETLEKIVTSCSGGRGGILMGFDGIAIDHFIPDELAVDLNLVGIEYSNISKEISRAADILKLGALNEVSIKTDSFFVILNVLTEEYFVALIVDRNGNYGQGRYLLNREAPGLRAEL